MTLVSASGVPLPKSTDSADAARWRAISERSGKAAVLARLQIAQRCDFEAFIAGEQARGTPVGWLLDALCDDMAAEIAHVAATMGADPELSALAFLQNLSNRVRGFLASDRLPGESGEIAPAATHGA